MATLTAAEAADKTTTPAQPIVIFGFPHCGTSILRTILSHADNVWTKHTEDTWAERPPRSAAQFVLHKYPFTLDAFLTDPKYRRHHKIMLMRDPRYVFTSLRARFGHIPDHHSVEMFLRTAERFAALRRDPSEAQANAASVHALRYEDLFADDFAALRRVLDAIGVAYSDRIFENAPPPGGGSHPLDDRPRVLPTDRPRPQNHESFRHWQINRPFVNNNDPSKINLPDDVARVLRESALVQSLWPSEAPPSSPLPSPSPPPIISPSIAASTTKRRRQEDDPPADDADAAPPGKRMSCIVAADSSVVPPNEPLPSPPS